MRVSNLVILLILSISQLLQGQSLCSENLRQVFFGPDNVVVAESDPSAFYMVICQGILKDIYEESSRKCEGNGL